MYKKIIMGSLVATSVMFSGCGSSDTTCRIDVQNAIDSGNYDKAISDLQGKCSTAFSKSDLSMNLAAAYMGKSGYSVNSIADMLINSGDDENSTAFTSFLDSVNTKKSPTSLPDLYSAENYFLKAIEDGNQTTIDTLCTASLIDSLDDSRRSNACFYIGLNETIKAANTITYLTGNINDLVDSIDTNTSTTPYDMRASLDALAWSMDTNYTSTEGNIIGKDVNISGASFAHVVVDYSANGEGIFYRLAKSITRDANNSTVVTDGYCDVNGSRDNCEGIENDDGSINMTTLNAANCYACPVIFDTNNTTLGIADLLVDSLNNGSSAIAAVANDPDITASIDDFKEEITGDRNGTVTIEQIIDYLQQ